MRAPQRRGWLWLLFLLAGCAAYQTAGQVQSGRQALIINRPEEALAYFQAAAQSRPDYIYISGSYQEGIWTYVGRSQYAMGQFPAARESFERALSVYRDDYLARIYLGLTLARGGEQTRGLKELQGGLKGLHDWLEYMNYSRPLEAFWDPLRHIRTEIEKDLAMISGKDLVWPTLIESAEWVGDEMEKEIDRVRRDEQRQFRDRDFPGRRGLSVGVGLGF
jgi:tetratricopeptide (TPR) repeat protein